MTRRAVVIIGHGSRQAESNERFLEVVATYQRRRPDLDVSHGFIELAAPEMSVALRSAAQRAEEVVALPMQLFHALHVKNDIPLVLKDLRAEFPRVPFRAADALGTHPSLAALAWKRACETDALPCNDPSDVSVVMVGRGASDPGATSDFYKVVRLFTEGRGLRWVVPCFIAIAEPGLDQALDFIARTRPRKVLVVPYLLLTGVLIDRIQEKVRAFARNYPWVPVEVAPPLGLDDLLLDVLDERVEQACSGAHALPCDTCRYRIELPGQQEHLGGLKTLLWSQRHRLTHNQAMPHTHAHKPMKKHVLVCGNVDCADRGSIRLLSTLRGELKQRGLRKEIEVTRTACMGRCGEGPTMAVYPDGIWYRGVQADDVNELIEEHLTGDRIVARLVDNIM